MISGSGAAMSHTKSHSPRSQTRSMISVQMRRTVGSWSRTRRGVNPRFTSFRRREWWGSSMSIIIGSAGESGRMPPALDHTSGVRDTCLRSW